MSDEKPDEGPIVADATKWTGEKPGAEHYVEMAKQAALTGVIPTGLMLLRGAGITKPPVLMGAIFVYDHMMTTYGLMRNERAKAMKADPSLEFDPITFPEVSARAFQTLTANSMEAYENISEAFANMDGNVDGVKDGKVSRQEFFKAVSQTMSALTPRSEEMQGVVESFAMTYAAWEIVGGAVNGMNQLAGVTANSVGGAINNFIGGVMAGLGFMVKNHPDVDVNFTRTVCDITGVNSLTDEEAAAKAPLARGKMPPPSVEARAAAAKARKHGGMDANH